MRDGDGDGAGAGRAAEARPRGERDAAGRRRGGRAGASRRGRAGRSGPRAGLGRGPGGRGRREAPASVSAAPSRFRVASCFAAPSSRLALGLPWPLGSWARSSAPFRLQAGRENPEGLLESAAPWARSESAVHNAAFVGVRPRVVLRRTLAVLCLVPLQPAATK